MNRKEYAHRIFSRREQEKETLRREFATADRIRSFVVDRLLEESLARDIRAEFPGKEEMSFRNDLRERKYVTAQMDRLNPTMEEIVYAFQDPGVVALMGEITGIRDLIPDEKLYAGGISLMTHGHFLNPHVDNSHDNERANYRVLNLLYYVTPDWDTHCGGHLELWDRGVRLPCRTVESLFNRLVVMGTGRSSWHSVNRITTLGSRCCISNYFFSPQSLEGHDYFHVTTFRGRPEQKRTDAILRMDNAIRGAVRLFFKKGLIQPWHIYQRKGTDHNPR